MALAFTGLIHPAFFLDDAYITGRNAFLLLQGTTVDPLYGTPSISGSTSTIHLLVVAIFSRVMPTEPALLCAAILGCWVYAAAAFAVTQQLKLGKAAPYALAMFLLVGIMPLHMLNGLETGLALGTSLWLLVLLMDNRTSSAFVLAALCGLAVHVRIELAALAIPAFLFKAYELSQHKVMHLPAPIFMGLLGLAAALPPVLFVHAQTGLWLPQTWNAKSMFYAQSCLPLLQKAGISLKGLIELMLISMPICLFLFFPNRQKLFICSIVFTTAFLITYGLIFPSALLLNFYTGRYSPILLPAWIFCFLTVMATSPKANKNIQHSSLLVCAIGIICSLTFAITPHVLRRGDDIKSAITWANQHIPANSALLVHDAGYIAHASTRFKLVDIVGLKTQWTAQVHSRITAPSCGTARPAAIAEIAHTSGALWGVFADDWYNDMDIKNGLLSAGYTIHERYRTGITAIYEFTKPN